MVHRGRLYGVNMYASHSICWFTDIVEAAAIEQEEVAKFLAFDREREIERLKKLNIEEAARSYSIALAEKQPGRKTRH